MAISRPRRVVAAAIWATVAYRGRGDDHVVTGPAGTLTAVFDPQTQPRGSNVEVALDPAGCVAYRATA